VRRPLLVGLLLVLGGVLLGSLLFLGPVPPPPGRGTESAAAPGPQVEASRGAVPQRARDVLAEIRRRGGEAPPGHVGGRVFGNRERRLPRGTYREYDVHPRAPGRSRSAERIVIEQRTGVAYYTPDHYQTFTPID
jgi:ribonuclease T1